MGTGGKSLHVAMFHLGQGGKTNFFCRISRYFLAQILIYSSHCMAGSIGSSGYVAITIQRYVTNGTSLL